MKTHKIHVDEEIPNEPLNTTSLQKNLSDEAVVVSENADPFGASRVGQFSPFDLGPTRDPTLIQRPSEKAVLCGFLRG